MDIKTLVKVTSRAWSLNILALMHNGIPGRQAPLLHASGASRTAFTQSLTHLIELDLLERNPGHGHPLRPEYRLTPSGIAVAKIAHEVEAIAHLEVQNALIRRSWTVPILAVSQEPHYFGELKEKLAPVTDRALSQSLFQLQEKQWITREIDLTTSPPRPLYQAHDMGVKIAQAVTLTP